MRGKDRVIEAHCTFKHVAESHLARIFRAAAIVDRDASLGGEKGERLTERQAVALHHKCEDVAPLAAAEALPGFTSWRDHE